MIAQRWRYRTQGGHVHVRVFAGYVPDEANPEEHTLALAGTLIFRASEWQEIMARMVNAGLAVYPEAMPPHDVIDVRHDGLPGIVASCTRCTWMAAGDEDMVLRHSWRHATEAHGVTA